MLRELIERPLFWETRKRAAIDLKPEPKVVEKKEKLKPEVVKENSQSSQKKCRSVTVVGIFGGGDTGGAILKVQGKEVRVLIGESMLMAGNCPRWTKKGSVHIRVS